MRLPLCYPIESRDGTLNADSKMKNMVVENVEGELIAVKRPGVTKRTELPSGLAQGLFSLNGLAYENVTFAIIGDKLFLYDSDFSFSGGFSLASGKSLLFNSNETYGYDDEVYVPDETTGVLVKFYALSPSANKGIPGDTGWRGLMWGTSPKGQAAYVATGRGVNISGTTPTLITAYGSTAAAAFAACCSGIRLSDSDGVNSVTLGDPYSLPDQLTMYVTNLSNGATINAGFTAVATINPL